MTQMAADPLDPSVCYEVPVRDVFGQPLVLRMWPEGGRIALQLGPGGTPAGGPVYVDVARTGELRSFLSASAYQAAVLGAEPNLREANGAGDDRT